MGASSISYRRTPWRKCPLVSRNVLWCVWFVCHVPCAHVLVFLSLAIPCLTWSTKVFYGRRPPCWSTVGPHCPTTYRYASSVSRAAIDVSQGFLRIIQNPSSADADPSSSSARRCVVAQLSSLAMLDPSHLYLQV